MKTLIFSTDKKIFDEGSAVRQRMRRYGESIEELHIIVFSKRKSNINSNSPISVSQNVFVYPTNSKNRWFYVFDAVKIGKRIMRNWKLESGDLQNDVVISCQDPFESGLVGWLIARKYATPLQLQIHTDFLSLYFRQESFLNRIRVRIARFLLPRAACIRTVSNTISRSLQAKSYKLQATPYVLPIRVPIEEIRNATPAFDLHEKYPQFKTIVLMVGRLAEEKNYPLALKAFHGITKNHPDVGLVIIGEGPEKERLERYVKDYGLQSNIVFEGRKDDVISYYKTADTFLLTSNYEGFGMALVEAAAADCPIITTRVGIVDEVFEDRKSAFLCDPGDSSCVIRSIQEFIKNTHRQRILTLQAQAAIERFNMSEEEYTKRYTELWHECVKMQKEKK